MNTIRRPIRGAPRASLPEGRDHLAVAVAGGKIYAFGGFIASVHKGAGTGAFEYDPAKDSWRDAAADEDARAARPAPQRSTARSMSSAAAASTRRGGGARSV